MYSLLPVFHFVFLSLPHQGEPGTPGEKVLAEGFALSLHFWFVYFLPLPEQLRELRNGSVLPSAQIQALMAPASVNKMVVAYSDAK